MTKVKILGAGLFFVLASCSGGDGGTEPDPDPIPETGAISGTVVEGTTGVLGATLALSGGGTATTNSDGEFNFQNVDVGSYTLTVTLPDGFTLAAGESASKSVTVTADQTATVGWGAVAGGDPPAQQDAAVTLRAASFDPTTVTIAVGSTVEWTNGTATAHTITPDDTSQSGAWADQSITGEGTTFSHTFDTAGEYDYHCTIHSGMTGEIVVQ